MARQQPSLGDPLLDCSRVKRFLSVLHFVKRQIIDVGVGLAAFFSFFFCFIFFFLKVGVGELVRVGDGGRSDVTSSPWGSPNSGCFIYLGELTS